MQDRMPNQQIQLSDAIASTSQGFPDAEGRCPVAVMKVGRLQFLQDLLGDELNQFSSNTVRPTTGAYMSIFETLTHSSSTAVSRCNPTADTPLASV